MFELDEDTIKFSDVLNPDLWENDKLKSNVLEALMNIAQVFVDYVDLDFAVEDIIFTGSMANYNFKEDSDIDLHIVTNYDRIGIDSDVLLDYFNAKKSLFNQNHNIEIYGHPVELYIENSKTPSEAKGKYSLINDEWIIKPEKITQEVEDVDELPKYLDYVTRINNVLSSEYNVEEAEKLLDEIYTIRKEGLKNSGELDEDNLIFKKLRSNGLLPKLRQYINDNYDKSLSLNESFQLFEGIEELQKYFPKLPLEKLKELVALDPTYKGGDQLGKYGKWIIKLAYNKLKNYEMKRQYDNLLKQYPDGVNPKTGEQFQPPKYLPAIKDEDLYKVNDSLKQYDILKKEIGKPIDFYKSLSELDADINAIKQQNVPSNEMALKRYNLMKKAV